MIGVTITITNQLAHNLWDVLTGVDTTGVSASKTYPGWKQGQSGSFHDIQLRTASANSGSIVLGDGSIASADPGLLPGDSQFYPGKMALPGLYFLSTTGAGGDPEILRVELSGGGIG